VETAARDDILKILPICCIRDQSEYCLQVGLWWTKWLWSRFSPSTSVSYANLYFTKFSMITISRGRYHRPLSGQRAEWTQYALHPLTMRIKKKINQNTVRLNIIVNAFCQLNKKLDRRSTFSFYQI
jgi:hypothetical protein